MNFKTRRIRKEKKHTKQSPHQETNHIQKSQPRTTKANVPIYTIGGIIVFIALLTFGIYSVISSLDLSSLLFSFGQELQTSPQDGHTNILLMGTGDEDHDGANLTDTIIVASINHDTNSVAMISIPRDFYIMDRQQRINSVYESELSLKGERMGINTLTATVEEITNLEMQYYIKVDFDGFVEIVDHLGGVDINVENSIYDPYYPRGNTTGYETFQLDAGYQTLDGSTALKYARSRKTTSDFDRSLRQQKLLFALKEKALKLEILTDPGKITDIYNAFSQSITTNLSLAEIIELAKIAKDINQENTFRLGLNDDFTSCGGLLYTPAREFFSGAAVLLPAGNSYEYIHEFMDITFTNLPAIQTSNDHIQVLNGTRTSGIAYEVLSILSRFCLPIEYYGNATERDLETTSIYYLPDEEGNAPAMVSIIQSFIPAQTFPFIPEEYLEGRLREDSNIVIELGLDYTQDPLEDPFARLQYLASPSSGDEDKDEDKDDDNTATSAEGAKDSTADPDTEVSTSETSTENEDADPVTPADEAPTSTLEIDPATEATI